MIGLCLSAVTLLALTATVLVATGGLSPLPSGSSDAPATAAPSRADGVASVALLEVQARGHARRLGLTAPPRTALPRSEQRLARRAAALENVVAVLSDRRELAPSIRPVAVPVAAGEPDPLRTAHRRAARESARLGIAPPRPPTSAAEPAARAAQVERWTDAADWLEARTQRQRPAERNAKAAALAMDYRGTPYVYGGAGPGGFDCSGLASYAYARVGTVMPHNTNAIWGAFPKVARRSLRPGDMVFFRGLGHMGIYIGGGRFVHAPSTGDVVKVEALTARPDYVGAVRAA